jgi:hypothetical protein
VRGASGAPGLAPLPLPFVSLLLDCVCFRGSGGGGCGQRTARARERPPPPLGTARPALAANGPIGPLRQAQSQSRGPHRSRCQPMPLPGLRCGTRLAHRASRSAACFFTMAAHPPAPHSICLSVTLRAVVLQPPAFQRLLPPCTLHLPMPIAPWALLPQLGQVSSSYLLCMWLAAYFQAGSQPIAASGLLLLGVLILPPSYVPKALHPQSSVLRNANLRNH